MDVGGGYGTGFWTEHVLSEILKRLPVKSLLRFLSVSKPWNHLITGPFFVNTHLHFNKLQSSSSSVLGFDICHTYSRTDHDGKFHYYRIDNTMKTASEHLEIKFPWKKHMKKKKSKVDDEEGISILGHCNDVVLALYSLDSQDMYIVTNPITRSFHILPESGIEIPNLTFVDDDPDYYMERWEYKKMVAIGFGFIDQLVYKVLRITYGMGRFVESLNELNQYRAYEPLWVEVYDSRSLSWRRVLVDLDLSYEHMHGGVRDEFYYNYTKYSHGGVYNSFDGCLYWLGKTATHSTVVSFDLVEETMHQTLVPYKPRLLWPREIDDHEDGVHEDDDDDVFGEYGTSLSVQVLGRSVVMLVGDQRNMMLFSVWKMKKEECRDDNKVSWTHMYRLNFAGSPKGFGRNGELLLRIDKARTESLRLFLLELILKHNVLVHGT